MKIIFASSNPGKIHELEALLENNKITLIPQNKLHVSDIAETGLTFVENALIKARHACEQTGLPAIADDSGLVVHALNGAPGIYSARYAGENASSAENIKKLLENMQGVPDQDRAAYFYCVLVFMLSADDPAPIICHGKWQGFILSQPQGQEGFGYDPVFYVPTEKCSAAELKLEIKNRISHRGQALRLLLEKLPGKLCEPLL